MHLRSASRPPKLPRAVQLPWLAAAGLLLCVLCFACVAACLPELPGARPGPEPDDPDAGAGLALEPEAPLDAALQVTRLRVRLPGVAPDRVDLARVLVFDGKVGPGHLRQIEEGELSDALTERIVPALAWIERDEQDVTEVVVAPSITLAAGRTYAVAGGLPPFVHHVRVAAEGAPPVLPRVWPPPDGGATVALGVWCGGEALPAGAAPAELAPDGPAGEIRRGAVDDVGARCVRFEAAPGEAAVDGAVFVGPPALDGEPPPASLDPRPFVLEVEPEAPTAAACAPGEVPFGAGCAAVSDDRLYARSAPAPRLWAISGEGLDLVVVARAEDPFLVAPLAPLSAVTLGVTSIDAAGRVERSTFSTTTLAPQPHVVITEILANPLGPEPAQEWVEIYNDGLVAADLAGYLLKDVGGEAALPAATLAPGGFALIVNEAFVEDDELDPPPAAGALILRVPKLGKDGLANAGEPLALRDAAGAVVSRAPAAPKTDAGESLARAGARAPDGLDGSFFVAAWPTPGGENILLDEQKP